MKVGRWGGCVGIFLCNAAFYFLTRRSKGSENSAFFILTRRSKGSENSVLYFLTQRSGGAELLLGRGGLYIHPQKKRS